MKTAFVIIHPCAEYVRSNDILSKKTVQSNIKLFHLITQEMKQWKNHVFLINNHATDEDIIPIILDEIKDRTHIILGTNFENQVLQLKKNLIVQKYEKVFLSGISREVYVAIAQEILSGHFAKKYTKTCESLERSSPGLLEWNLKVTITDLTD